MPHTMGMQAFPLQAWHRRLRAGEVFVQDVADTKAAQRVSALIDEEGQSSPHVQLPLGTQLAEQGRGLGPQRTHALFAPLAEGCDRSIPNSTVG